MSTARPMRADEAAGFAALMAQCAKEPPRFAVQSSAELFTGGELAAHKKYLAEQGARYAERLNDAATKERDRIRKASGEKAAKRFEEFALGLQSAEKFATKADTTSEWQVKNLIPRTGSGLHSGASGTLKSFAEIWIGEQIHESGGKAVLVIAEGSAGFRRRLRAYSKHTGVPLADLPAVLPFAVDLSDIDSVIGFIGALKVLHPDVTYIAFDTKWRCSGALKENDATDQAKLFANVDLIARTFNAFCMLVAHLGKSEEKGVRGSNSQYAAVDIELRQERDGERCTLRTEKNKDGPDDIQRVFDVVHVDLGRNAIGDPESSLVLVESEDLAEVTLKAPKGKYEKVIWDCAQGYTSERFTEEALVNDATDILRKSNPKVLPKNVRRALKAMIGEYFIMHGEDLALRASLVHDNAGWLE